MINIVNNTSNYQNYVAKNGMYVLNKSCYSMIELQKYRQDLSIRPINLAPHIVNSAFIKPIKIYKENDTKLFLPRSYGMKNVGIPQYHYYHDYTLYQPIPITCNIVKPLFDHQVDISQMIVSYLKEKDGALVELPCGWGKTALINYVISELKLKTLIIVTSNDLMRQMEDDIHFFLPTARIGYVQGDRMDYEDKDIIIGMVNTLCNKDYPPNFIQSIGLVVYDECHHVSATTFRTCLFKYPARYQLCVSATIERTDGLTSILKHYIGDVAYSKKGIDTTPEYNITVYPIYITDHHSSIRRMKQAEFYEKNSYIVSNQERNQAIANQIQLCIFEHPRRNLLVLVEQAQHARNIYALLAQYLPESYYGLVIGGESKNKANIEKRKKSIKKRIIVGTYRSLSEGFSKKGINTLFLGSHKKDIVQSLGRILRDKDEIKYDYCAPEFHILKQIENLFCDSIIIPEASLLQIFQYYTGMNTTNLTLFNTYDILQTRPLPHLYDIVDVNIQTFHKGFKTRKQFYISKEFVMKTPFLLDINI